MLTNVSDLRIGSIITNDMEPRDKPMKPVRVMEFLRPLTHSVAYAANLGGNVGTGGDYMNEVHVRVTTDIHGEQDSPNTSDWSFHRSWEVETES